MLEANRNRNSKKIIRRNNYRISETDKRQMAEISRKRKRCNRKKRYETKEAAQEQCNKIHSDVALQLTPLEPYFCSRHDMWHIGHDWYKYKFNKRNLNES